MKPIYSIQLLFILILILVGRGSGTKGIVTFIFLLLVTFFNLYLETTGNDDCENSEGKK